MTPVTQTQDDFNRYADFLAPLFRIETTDPLQLVASLLRVHGREEEGWDTLAESREMLADLIALNKLDLPTELFDDTQKTHWRLHLLSYVQVTEMNAPYHVMVNLLRAKAGMPYLAKPFKGGSPEPAGRDRKPGPPRTQAPSPSTKINEIRALAERCKLGNLSQAFHEFYHSALRNAIAHSDYVLHNSQFRMINNRIVDPAHAGRMTSVVALEGLEEVIAKTYDFYTAFFTLEAATRASFASHAGRCYTYDPVNKGLLEFLVDEKGLLNGFKIHWPDGADSIYQRSEGKCLAQRILMSNEGRMEFPLKHVSNPDSFSPLLTKGQTPIYTPTTGQQTAPVWPGDGKFGV